MITRLKALGSTNPQLRENQLSKTGPVKTDQDFFIIDAPFPPLRTAEDVAAGKEGHGQGGAWQVEILANQIRAIHGVLEVGIFSGLTGPEAAQAGTIGGERPVACYFGMEDGSVTVRRAHKTV